jgi:capsular exopolysaccharide synthesis family protein
MVFGPTSSIAESFQSLRTSILLSKAGTPPKFISITSAVAGEGKTTVSINLAATFASHGARVLLLEGDMRRSKLAATINMGERVGLSNVLTGTASFEEAVSEYPGVSNLSLMVAGPRPPIPAELLGSERFARLLNTASEQFDFVFVDTPPAVLVTDAVLISPKMDGTICVVRAGKTTRPLLFRVSELLRRSECRFLGFALNAVQTGSADYYHYYGYHGNGDYYNEVKTQ